VNVEWEENDLNYEGNEADVDANLQFDKRFIYDCACESFTNAQMYNNCKMVLNF